MFRIAKAFKPGFLALLVAASAAAVGHAWAPEVPGTLTVVIDSKTDGGMVLTPGDLIDVGYIFAVPGKHGATAVDVILASVTMHVVCANGDQEDFVINLPGTNYSVAMNDTGWIPTGDKSDPASYQAQLAAPDVCGGGPYKPKNGATFVASITSATSVKVNVKFHWRANGSAGGWSGTKTVTPLT